VIDTDARVFFYDFLRLFQNIQPHLPAAYFLIQSGDFLPQRIAFCFQGSLSGCLDWYWKTGQDKGVRPPPTALPLFCDVSRIHFQR
ncbi:hypothetical protein, partial [Escherichia coli]|uniref:hypothetical protein n=1 Tax=Escherichia coli TaxID=562 RepID=UPI001BB13979